MRELARFRRILGRRRWLLPALILLVIGGAFLLFWPRPEGTPALELVVLDAGGRFAGTVRTASLHTDTVAHRPDVVARFPFLLALRNTGDAAARPDRVRISMPLHLRLRARDDWRLAGRLAPSGPLIEYEVRGPFPEVEPGRVPALLTVPDTVWLEVVLPHYYCVEMGDGVPTFIPAPPAPVETMAESRIFYSLSGEDLPERQTGLLSIRLDPERLRRPEPEAPPAFPTELADSRANLPAMSALRPVGTRRSFCGEPARPMQFLTTLWETPEGGRFFVIDYDGAPRKYLFDLDRDGVIEREIWDPDGDGDFEASRDARMPIPGFLLPLPAPGPTLRWAGVDAFSEDSLAALHAFRDAMDGPYEPRTEPPDTTPRRYALRPHRLRGSERAGEHYVRRPEPMPAPQQPAPAPNVLGAPNEPAPVGAADAAQGRHRTPRAEEPARAPRPEPQPRARPAEPDEDAPADTARDQPRLLGVPVDSVDARRSPPDTSGVRR